MKSSSRSFLQTLGSSQNVYIRKVSRYCVCAFCWFFLIFTLPLSSPRSFALTDVVQCHCWKYHQLVNLICTASTKPTSVIHSSRSPPSSQFTCRAMSKEIFIFIVAVQAQNQGEVYESTRNQIILFDLIKKYDVTAQKSRTIQSILSESISHSRKKSERLKGKHITCDWVTFDRYTSVRYLRDVLVRAT